MEDKAPVSPLHLHPGFQQRQRVDTLKIRSTRPLVIEIPGPAGPNPDQPTLSEIIRRTIGVKI